MNLTPHSAEGIRATNPAGVNSLLSVCLSVVHIHTHFFPPRCVRQEAHGFHPIQRKTAGKVAGNFGEME
jgi:hypothetical protein